MLLQQLLLIAFTSTVLNASRLHVKKGGASETYRKLFKPRYMTKLEEGDVAGAREALAKDLDVSFIPGKYQNTKKKIAEIFDNEKLTDEVFNERRFDNIEEAKQAYKAKPEVEKARQERQFQLLKDINYYKSQKTSFLRPFFNTLSQYLPSIADKIDPLAGAPSVEDLQKQLEDLQKERNKRQDFIEAHKRWFLKKKYYTDDQFGLERAMKNMQQSSADGTVLQGDGQTILVMDRFTMVMPERVKEKCINYDAFKNVPTSAKDSHHGLMVASVAVDSEFGIAPNANFRAALRLSHVPKVTPFNFLKPDRVCTKNTLDFFGDLIEPHHLMEIDEFLQNDPPKFAVKNAKGEVYCIDTTDMRIPEESVINMSFSYFDSIGDKRNHTSMKEIHNFIAFATMVLKFARAGKIIVWAAGNDSISVGDSLGYSLIRALSLYKPECFISALALDRDNISMGSFTNQPGNHPIHFCSLSAPGTDVRVVDADNEEARVCGTSFAAPYISGVMALLMSNFPEATAQEVRDALIYMAAPVVMKPSESRNGEFPLVIRNARNGNLIPGKDYKYFGKDIDVKSTFVTSAMISRGRAKYGVGIINISGAATYLHMKRTESEGLARFINKAREAEWEPHLC